MVGVDPDCHVGAAHEVTFGDPVIAIWHGALPWAFDLIRFALASLSSVLAQILPAVAASPLDSPSDGKLMAYGRYPIP